MKEILKKYNLSPKRLDDASKRMEQHLKDNGARGLKMPFSAMNKYYSMKYGGCTDWTGAPGSGKTYFVLENIISISRYFGKRFLLWLPDLGGYEDQLEKLVKMYSGFDMHDKFNNKIPDSKLYSTLAEILHRTPLMDKLDEEKPLSPIDLWEYTCHFEDEHGTVDGCVADSWKDFSHDYSGREDQYLDKVLAKRNSIAEKNNKHFHTIAHAPKMDLDKNGKRRIPTASDIKGGGAWEANGRSIITVDYPDKEKTGVNIFVNRIKPESVGVVGEIINKIYLDRQKGRYFEFINGYKYYAYEYLNLDDTDIKKSKENPNQVNMFGFGNVDSEESPI